MKLVILFLGLFISIIFETTLISLPLVLLWLLLLVVLTREEWVFIVAIIAGLILDSLRLSTFGLHALFFAGFCLLVFLYEQKFELQSSSFVLVMSFLGSAIYLLIFGSTNFILQVLCSSFLAIIFFLPLSFLYKNHIRSSITPEFS